LGCSAPNYRRNTVEGACATKDNSVGQAEVGNNDDYGEPRAMVRSLRKLMVSINPEYVGAVCSRIPLAHKTKESHSHQTGQAPLAPLTSTKERSRALAKDLSRANPGMWSIPPNAPPKQPSTSVVEEEFNEENYGKYAEDCQRNSACLEDYSDDYINRLLLGEIQVSSHPARGIPVSDPPECGAESPPRPSTPPNTSITPALCN